MPPSNALHLHAAEAFLVAAVVGGVVTEVVAEAFLVTAVVAAAVVQKSHSGCIRTPGNDVPRRAAAQGLLPPRGATVRVRAGGGAGGAAACPARRERAPLAIMLMPPPPPPAPLAALMHRADAFRLRGRRLHAPPRPPSCPLAWIFISGNAVWVGGKGVMVC